WKTRLGGRLAWVEVGGVPFKLWTVKTFSRIASKWGDLMNVDEDELNYHSKRLCVFTKVRQNIQESFKINFHGKVHWVRAIEVPGWIPEFNDEEEEDDVSDECKISCFWILRHVLKASILLESINRLKDF
ncbi:hypothetical protein Tco_0372775, partial [Tanacetum coccineum]